MSNISEIHNQTNTRIYERNIPQKPLQPYLDVRPVMTKYSYLPIVDPRKELHTKFIQLPTYNSEQNFNPGNTQSPWSGFASNINKESELRNQIFALQKCSQSVYVPSANSDLYDYGFTPLSVPQTHALLFKQEKFNDCNPNPDLKNIGS